MKQKHLLKQLSAADFVTLTATFLIIVSLWLLWNEQIYLAVSIAFISMFLDYLDGTIARKFGGSEYGKVLDSLYDVVGFVIFPSLVIISQTGWAWWSLIVSALFHLSAVLRLARFTSQGYVETKKLYYIGLPVLFSKYALLSAFVLEAKIAVLVLAVMVPLMVSSRPIKKPHPLFAYLNIVYAFAFIGLYLNR